MTIQVLVSAGEAGVWNVVLSSQRSLLMYSGETAAALIAQGATLLMNQRAK
jgi:hypothetical protein